MKHYSTPEDHSLALAVANRKADEAEKQLTDLAYQLAATEPGTFDYVHLERKQRLTLVYYNRLVARIHALEKSEWNGK